MTESVHTGGCLCGAVRYELQGEPDWTVYCHCESCRKHTGGPVAAFATYLPEHVVWTNGERKRYESSPGRQRSFCEHCGSSLTFEAHFKDRDWLAMMIGTMDNPEHFAPTEHTCHEETLSWLALEDSLKKFGGLKNL